MNIYVGVFMARVILVIAILLPLLSLAGFAGGNPQIDRFRATAERMHAWTTADKGLYPMLADFTDHYPKRLSGSEFLERVLDWIIAKMKSEGWDVKTQDVMVPHWERGAESLTLKGPYTRSMPFCALGGSIGTGGKPLRAKVLVVSSFADLAQRAADAKGRIVVYNVPFTTYGETVRYRSAGASEAARYGAVASLVRSVGPYGIQTPHTGGMGYQDSVAKIPAGAITIEDALLLQRFQDRGETVELELSMSARWLPDAKSRNVIIEIKGSELPNEVVVMGGHIDSWDLGTGAMDDAGGCFVAWRALTMMRQLGLRPKRTIRVCFWTNEENGLRGGNAYAEQTKNERHVLAIESDAGTFAPTGFNCSDTGEYRQYMEQAAELLNPIHANRIETGGGGADIGPLKKYGAVLMGLEVQGDRYFWYHHTEGDTIDKLTEHEVNDCVYAMAIIAWAGANK